MLQSSIIEENCYAREMYHLMMWTLQHILHGSNDNHLFPSPTTPTTPRDDNGWINFFFLSLSLVLHGRCNWWQQKRGIPPPNPCLPLTLIVAKFTPSPIRGRLSRVWAVDTNEEKFNSLRFGWFGSGATVPWCGVKLNWNFRYFRNIFAEKHLSTK